MILDALGLGEEEPEDVQEQTAEITAEIPTLEGIPELAIPEEESVTLSGLDMPEEEDAAELDGAEIELYSTDKKNDNGHNGNNGKTETVETGTITAGTRHRTAMRAIMEMATATPATTATAAPAITEMATVIPAATETVIPITREMPTEIPITPAEARTRAASCSRKQEKSASWNRK